MRKDSADTFIEFFVNKLSVKQPIHNVLGVRPFNHGVDWIAAQLRAPLGVPNIVAASVGAIPDQVVEEAREMAVVFVAWLV